ncbi:tRNA (adenosine(37)-N6)-dimethylallyltransferase MiaA [Aestuariirhabdus sp. Z084]|uniref:tRNA (adenosine(37)-N6)-dimethylallyltransferase MiaA n=1 Tax=Aestuariirhabdus haliotis TaxID=2918751 RepID=UPI00201B3E7F|nr:tRNA (adenosine(37)-N6)-dimethylallyltransferase MiaA [Aestuariirhabdus haliotis]MCL6415636.1 tRNA (adenosine(37)-N6)-dimethylallyltransferase MiaA [Aestuariirhabdus haliotis]MCL6419631.1 tRNA (adenosine(37)-N6)-dimethylallyltransferase MiaA [Aestuariirhabdus haliotis]
MGPTAAGKTDLAVELSERLPCDLISVDSAMVYREMNIGTAKPEPELLQRAPHQLIDIRDPADPYSAAQFAEDALEAMRISAGQGRVPLLVGGTMLYFKALRDGLADMPGADEGIRQRLLDEAERSGWGELHERLAKLDPESAARIHPNDPQRLQRALELIELTGKSMTRLREEQRNARSEPFPFRILSIAVAPDDRSVLHERIALRFQQMMEQGFIEEVEQLYQRGDLNLKLPSIRSVGYRQVWEYLDGELEREAMVEKGIIATRQLAKRQYTWLRSWGDLHWLDSLSDQLTESALKKFPPDLI